MSNIIAFIGNAGSGKDYQCSKLVEQGYVKLAFADALREIAFASLCIDYNQGMEHYDFLKKHDVINVFCPDGVDESQGYFRQFSFRTFLQKLGTEGIRNYDNDFWCRCMIKKIKEQQIKNICISDMRFINEYKYVRDFAIQNGYNFKVIYCNYKSDRYIESSTHASERMANWFTSQGKIDLQELNDDDFIQYEKQLELSV